MIYPISSKNVKTSNKNRLALYPKDRKNMAKRKSLANGAIDIKEGDVEDLRLIERPTTSMTEVATAKAGASSKKQILEMEDESDKENKTTCKSKESMILTYHPPDE